VSPEHAFQVEETRRGLIEAINRLPDRDRLVITLYYYEGMTLAEIGDVLGVTESRVCQIHAKTMMSLRHRLGEPSWG
jgi:RNA polymerase sigma factor FliA